MGGALAVRARPASVLLHDTPAGSQNCWRSGLGLRPPLHPSRSASGSSCLRTSRTRTPQVESGREREGRGRVGLVRPSRNARSTCGAGVNPYPPNATVADAFDGALGDWAASLNETALLSTAAGLADSALSCGFTGIVLLHGLLRAGTGGLGAWAPTLAAGPLAPTYYGMLVSTVLPASRVPEFNGPESELR